MEKFEKSQLIAKIFLLVLFLALLLLTPFISISMRSSCLYFLLNLLIIVIGIEAGLLSSAWKPCDENKKVAVTTKAVIDYYTATTTTTTMSSSDTMKLDKTDNVLKRCRSRPSLFFIGSGKPEEDDVGVKEEEVVIVNKVGVKDEVGEMSKQELFMKAELFIGNFYKQLKMQREDSWQKLHGLCHKAF